MAAGSFSLVHEFVRLSAAFQDINRFTSTVVVESLCLYGTIRVRFQHVGRCDKRLVRDHAHRASSVDAEHEFAGQDLCLALVAPPEFRELDHNSGCA